MAKIGHIADLFKQLDDIKLDADAMNESELAIQRLTRRKKCAGYSHTDFAQSPKSISAQDSDGELKQNAIYQLCLVIDSISFETFEPIDFYFSLAHFNKQTKTVTSLSEEYAIRILPTKLQSQQDNNLGSDKIAVFKDITEHDLERETVLYYRAVRTGSMFPS
ncbi:MAG: hypothetical protein EZS28_013968, partial [Streblomastix strix]